MFLPTPSFTLPNALQCLKLPDSVALHLHLHLHHIVQWCSGELVWPVVQHCTKLGIPNRSTTKLKRKILGFAKNQGEEQEREE